jgi:hypothetical protein
MPTNESIPIFEPADRVSGVCVGAVTGKRFVNIAADIPGGPTGTENIRVATCGAGLKAAGVSCYDGVDGELIPLHTDHSAILMPAGAAITAGQEVESDAQGRPIPLAAGKACGKAWSAQAVVGSDVLIKLYS